MNRTVLINRLKLAASLIGSRHSLSQRRGYSRLNAIIDDLRQQKEVYDVEYYDYDPYKVLRGLKVIIGSGCLYNELSNFIKQLESCHGH